MSQRVKFLLTVLLATVLLAGCGGQDTLVEQAEQEAGVEEVIEETTEQALIEETTERDIPREGCPPGQVSNAAGTECMEQGAAPKHEPDPAYMEEANRREAERIVKGYESGMSNIQPVECQLAKAELDLGSQEAQRLVDEFIAPVTEGPSVRELQEQGVPPDEAMRQVSERMRINGTLDEYLAEKGYAC